MAKLRLFLILVCSTVLLTSCTSPQKEDSFQLRSFEEYQMENGLRVLMIPDRTLPYISLNMLVKAGSSQDPETREGLAYMVSELLDRGTQSRNAIALADELGHMGAEFSASTSSDYTFLAASALSFQKERLLDLVAEIVTRPAFQRSEISRLKTNLTAQIQKIVDQPEAFTNRVFQSFLYPGHPYGRSTFGTVKSLKALRLRDINRFYLRYYRPNNALLAVVGKFNAAEMKARLSQVFGGWQRKDVTQSSPPSFPEISGRRIQLVHKTGLVQSQVRFGLKGIRRTNPDFLKIRLANTILGGAYASRLNDRIRGQLGLTYHISSYFDARQSAGPFAIRTYTRNEKVGELIQEIYEILEGFHDQGVSEKEVEQAKGLMMGSFPRAIETPERLAFNLLVLRYYGLGDQYLSNFIDEVQKISATEVNAVIKKYFSSKNMKVLVYSEKGAAEKQLRGLGEVQVESYKAFVK